MQPMTVAKSLLDELDALDHVMTRLWLNRVYDLANEVYSTDQETDDDHEVDTYVYPDGSKLVIDFTLEKVFIPKEDTV